MSTALPLVGLLPAAGRGTRLKPYRSPKELLPLLIPGDDGGKTAVPAPVCHFSLQAMQIAGAERCIVVISEEKCELLRVLSDGEELGLSLGYLVQRSPKGLTNLIASAGPWIQGADVLFAMPDTVLFPTDALKTLHEERKSIGADLMLGLFPTEEPERLAPVITDANGRVSEIQDKPKTPKKKNTWGVLSWSPRFTELCIDWEGRRNADVEGKLSAAMQAAVDAGLDVRAHAFENGIFRDVGTPGGLASTVALLFERGLLFSG